MFLLLACDGPEPSADSPRHDTSGPDSGTSAETAEPVDSADTGTPDTDSAPADSDTAATADTGGPSVPVDDAGVKLTGTLEWNWAGYVLAPAGDLDADGGDDILVRASEPQAVYVVPGPIPADAALADVGYPLSNGDDGFWVSLAGDADLDGDGIPDVVIGAPQGSSRDPGFVYLVHGPVTGPVDLASAQGVDGHITWISSEGYDDPYSDAGCLVALADVSGDGRADILVADDYAGEVYLVESPVTISSFGDATLTFTAGPAWSLTGGTLASAGDIDGDGIEDAYVAVPGAGDAGIVYALHGPSADWTDLDAADTLVTGDEDHPAWGPVASAGDTDGDGRPDLLIGQPGGSFRAGGGWLLLSPPAGTVPVSDAVAQLVGEEGDEAGISVAGVGDTDGDGFDDFVLGGADMYPYVPGGAWLVRGPAIGRIDLRFADLRIAGRDDQLLGYAVSAAGDLDSDGFADFLVGGPGDDDAAENAGAAWVISGADTR